MTCEVEQENRELKKRIKEMEEDLSELRNQIREMLVEIKK